METNSRDCIDGFEAAARGGIDFRRQLPHAPRFSSEGGRGEMRVGEDVRAHCGHCGEVWHVVVALAGGTIAQVECCDCNRRHRYRSQTNSAAGTARRARRPKAPPAVEADLERPPRGYDPRTRYRTGDRVNHPRFGEGVVQAVSGPTKMQVLFASGPRLLVHARK